MDVNLRHNEYFVQDASWHESSARFGEFIEQMDGKKLVCLELGVGYNTPGIIRYPFEKLVYRNGKATLVRLNRDDPSGLPENEKRTVAFCCISTGEFRFPPEEAARIAIRTVRDFLTRSPSVGRIVFNVFKDSDREIYERRLAQ